MKKILGLTLILAISICFFLLVVGITMDERHVIARGTTYQTPVNNVWDKITDHQDYPNWNEAVAQVEKLPVSDQGNEIWRFIDNNGDSIIVENVEIVDNEKLVSKVLESDYPYEGIWIFDLREQDEGSSTYLKITEDGSIPNPFLRAVSNLFIGYDAGVNSYLNNLGTALGEENIQIDEIDNQTMDQNNNLIEAKTDPSQPVTSEVPAMSETDNNYIDSKQDKIQSSEDMAPTNNVDADSKAEDNNDDSEQIQYNQINSESEPVSQQ